MNTKSLTPDQLLKNHFTIKSLKSAFDSKVRLNRAKGIDRINAAQFANQSKHHLQTIKSKCLKGTYKFSPYLERLKPKGRGKAPRVLAIPTVRDRIVLHQLKEILFQIFPECVPRKLANTYIYEIKKYLDGKSPNQLGVFRTDIKNFYGEINRSLLFEKLRLRIKSTRLLTLIEGAITTPVVPKHYKRKNRNNYQASKGIPQGLSISNILAAIYLMELDQEFKNSDVKYFRYVDDILIFSSLNENKQVESLVEDKFQELELSCNPDKNYSATGESAFDYLGYRFELPKHTI